MSEANGIAVRLHHVEGAVDSLWREQRDQRDRQGDLSEKQAVLRRDVDDAQADINGLGERIDRMARAFWAAAAALGTLAVAIMAVVVTILTGGGS